MSPTAALHQGGPVLAAGAPLTDASAALVLLHGRGASAGSILELATALHQDHIAYLAPQAAGGVWYPYPFLAPIESNEPWLTSALARVGELVAEIERAGISAARILLLGFSQGACLALEFAARDPRRWGGVIGLSGGLIGPPGGLREYTGTLDGAPVFLGCSDVDAHIPKARVEESAVVFRRIGADVTLRLYPGMGHTVNADELAFIADLLGEFGPGLAAGEGG